MQCSPIHIFVVVVLWLQGLWKFCSKWRKIKTCWQKTCWQNMLTKTWQPWHGLEKKNTYSWRTWHGPDKLEIIFTNMTWSWQTWCWHSLNLILKKTYSQSWIDYQSCYLIKWNFATETIQGRKLFKGRNYMSKYGT